MPTWGQVLRLTVIAGSFLAAAASATAPPPMPACAADQSCGPRTYPVPALQRSEVLEEEKGVEHVAVHGLPVGATGWKVAIANDGDDAFSIVWDECSFVAANGESAGRLVRGETKKIDVEKAQPPTPVAPHAHMTQIVIPEKFADEEADEEALTNSARRADQKGLAAIKERRDTREFAISGGRLYLVITGADGKRTWTGIVKGPPPPAAPPPAPKRPPPPPASDTDH